MKNFRISLCIIALASLLCTLTPTSVFAQGGGPIKRDSILRTMK
jgi:hypothetical protein